MLQAMLTALAALLRVQPQVRGVLCQQDVTEAIEELRAAIDRHASENPDDD